MFEKIKNFIKRTKGKTIFKVFSLTALSTVIKLFANLISIKVLAVLIGPSGIALLGQLSNFSAIAQTIGSGGINNGVTKYVAEYKESEEKIKHLISTSTKISLYLSIIIGILPIIFSDYLSVKILKSADYSIVFVFFGFTLCLYTLNNQLLAILNGFREFKKYVTINIIASFVGLSFTLLLVFFFSIKGALIAAISFQSITFFVSLFFVLKSPWFKKTFVFSRFNYFFAKKLFGYSMMMLVTAFTVPVSQIIVRNFITKKISIVDAGIWEGINKISVMYLMLITSSLGIYYLPKLSEIKTLKKIRDEVFNVYKFIIPITIAAIFFIFIFNGYIVEILFTKEFSSMRIMFPYQLVGDFFKIMAWVLSFIMVAKSKTKLYIITELVFSGIFVSLSMIWIKKMGLIGASFAYMINYILYFIGMLVVFNKLFLKINLEDEI